MRFSLLAVILPSILPSVLALSPVDIIQLIAPSSACCSPSTPDCRTAAQAGPLIFAALSAHNLCHPAAQAASIALMAFESAEFKYKHNVFPGRPGQGTANMQMPGFNLLYAKSLPCVADQVAQYASTEGLSDAQLDEILGYVTVDEYNFGSGPWFLATQCGEDVRSALEEDPDTGFAAYMKCVGVEMTEDRLAYFTRAKQAFDLL